MNLWHDVSVGKNIPDEINVIIEIPKGSLNKYEVDKETGMIALDRVSHTAQVFPFDYGFAPQTLWEDGDPLDVVVLTTEPLFPGVLLSVRPVAVMKMIDSGESDDKIIAVPTEDPRFNHVKDLADLNEHQIKTFVHYYENYKKLQNKEVTIPSIEGVESAKASVMRSIELYNEKFGAK